MTKYFPSRCVMLGGLFALATFLADARGQAPAPEDVPKAIAKLARQGFFGTISVRKDTFLPPDPDKARYAEQYNPDRPSADGSVPERTPEQRARLASLYERFKREAVEGTPYAEAFELTLGPNGLVRYDYHYVGDDVPPSVSVVRADSGCWLYNHGEPVRYTWSGVASPGEPADHRWRIERLLYEADYETRFIVNFGIDDWKRHMVRSVEKLADGRLRAEVASPTGIWIALFAEQGGQLVLVERTRVRGDDDESRYRYSDIADVQGVLIPRHILYTHGPAGAADGDKRVARFEYRVVNVQAGLGADWAELFELPDTWTDKTGEETIVLFEQSLDAPDAPLVPLHYTAAPPPVAPKEQTSHTPE